MKLPASWQKVVGAELTKPYFRQLEEFLTEERQQYVIYPPADRVFTALQLTAFSDVRAVILGQDPYHNEGQAHGLSFSVLPGVRMPGSLLNIFKELKDDVGCTKPKHGCLIPWAQQGVLLLNTVLTVRAHVANSHRGKGWEIFTDAIIRHLSERGDPMVFLLWGNHAQAKKKIIDTSKHVIFASAHPSPLSAKNGFFGSRPFSKTNQALRSWGKPEINWQIPDDVRVP